MAPLVPAKQATWVADTLADNAAEGCVIVDVMVAEHPFASVIVAV